MDTEHSLSFSRLPGKPTRRFREGAEPAENLVSLVCQGSEPSRTPEPAHRGADDLGTPTPANAPSSARQFTALMFSSFR